MINRISPNTGPLSRRQTSLLLSAALAAVVPLAPYFPAWLQAATAVAFILRIWLLRRGQDLPARWLLTLFALTSALAIGVYYHTLFGKDAGVALLIAFLALKLLEMRTARDGMAVILLAYFLMLANFLYSQTIAAAVTVAVMVTVITTALVNINHERQSVTVTIRLAVRLLVQAMPFMLLLFVLFPRVSGPLWGLPNDAYGALTGLSETMSPGSISRLSQSDAIAFRAKFSGMPPTHAALYWRGPVLSRFDGRSWHKARVDNAMATLPYRVGTDDVAYEVTLEPHNKNWLFALELPSSLPPESRISSDYQLLSTVPIRNRQRYAMRSQSHIVAGRDEKPSLLQESLRLPEEGNPRTRQWARELRAQGGTDGDIIASLLNYYRRMPFYYTLEPPLLGNDSIDEFLFDSRRGFCEHYAASFVFVLRAAGIPARVVTGYQGGEVNPVDHYLEVRQSDAHAWAEVWLAGEGWQRVDPTAAIAPARIELNLAAALPAGEPLPFLSNENLLWLRELRYRWDAISNGWNQWVLGYNPQRQRDLLQNFGMHSPDWQRMTAAMATLCGALMLALTLWNLRRHKAQDPALAAWNRFSAKLHRRHLGRRAWEGPSDYAERISTALPEKRTDVLAIARLYESLRYGMAGQTPTLPELKRRIAAFAL